MEEITFKNFLNSLKTKAPEGQDGALQVKKILSNLKPEQLWLIKSINENELKFVIGILGMTYKEVIQTLRLQANLLEKVVNICEEPNKGK